ncbi:protease HtpX [Aliamphritea spongicola]|uniref:protease HtpX n=1 Tax=Aliamphritea spongicola TaxID=707589 RepID=UPI00196B3525|nr:protease HtpX [Aliamphritea spongicola]MBN3561648.1 protease HtpX [Aliamphritea spongicola]
MRIVLFLLTNLAIILVASVTLSLLGVGSTLQANGVDLDLGNLLIICAVFGFMGSFVSLLLSKFMAKRSTGLQMIEQASNADEQWLMDTVQELATEAGIGMPEVGIFPAEQANAFATGWNKNNALVGISLGLLQRFRREEIRAVLAHEIGHIANGDMVTLTLIQGVVNTFVMFFARIIGHFVDRVILKNEEGHGIGYFVASIVAELVLGILASTIVAWFSRRREFRADEMGARLAGNFAMIGALQRLKAEYEVPDQMPSTMTAFGISSHLKEGFMAAFATHPPLDDRIAALQK